MRRIGIVLGIAILVAAMATLMAGAALAQATTETFHNQGEFAFTVENPCTGEDIEFKGRYRNPIHTTLNENGYHYVTRGTVINTTGTGLETGDKYRFVNPGGAVGYAEIEGEVGGLFVNNEELMYLVISEGESPNFLMHLLYKTTYDVDGQPAMGFVGETIGCTPKVESTHAKPV